jgi:pre-mRNA-splicing factor 18
VNGVLDLGLVKSDPDKLYPIIYYALKRTLKEWEEAMDERPGALIRISPCSVCDHQLSFTSEHIKRSTQGNWQLLPKSNQPST